jgi:hypothetical protein
MTGYYLGGLTGLGFSFLISYTLYCIQVFTIAKIKYDFSFHKEAVTLFFIQFLLALVSFIVVNLIEYPYIYLPGIMLIAISSWYSFRELEKRIGIREMIREFTQKIKKNSSL